jgi:hypothetical protein
MKFNILFLILFLSVVSAAIAQGDALEKHLKKFKNQYSLGKDITSAMSLRREYIDTTFLLNYKLINTYFKKGTPDYEKTRIKHLSGYQCEHIGHYKTKHGILLLSKSLQTTVGIGSPTLTISSIDKNGKLTDYARFEWEGEQSEGVDGVMIFTITPDFKITHQQQTTIYKTENGKRMPLRTARFTTTCTLLEDGRFEFKE